MANLPYIFAGETGNIPLSYLDVNFANVQAFANTAGNVTNNVQSNITSVGTLTSLSVTGTISGPNVYATVHSGYSVSVTGDITSGNTIRGNTLIISENITANTIAGNITTASQPNITVVGNLTSLSVIGNTISGNISAGNVSAVNATFSGDLVVSGNATVNGTTTTINSQTLNIADKDIVVANNVATSALIDGAGILAGNPTVSYLKYSNSSLGWATGNNFNIGGNLTVTGEAFATTPGNSVSNTQVATTAFVQNVVINATGSLGTMSTQNANDVSITGGNITGNNISGTLLTGTLTTAAQPNITSVGNLSSLNVSGNITMGNITSGNITGGNINSLAVTSIGNNSFGTRTVSSSAPSGGSNGDIWYKI